MNTPRYLLAKYVPDPVRMEPRNIGVVLWAEGNITARFAGDPEDAGARFRLPHRLDVADRGVYRRWIAFWREQIEQPELRQRACGSIVSRNDPKFLDALTAKSDFSFMLVPGGTLRTNVSTGEMQDAVSDLYERLVLQEGDVPEMKTESDSELLRRAWHKVAVATKLREKTDYQEDFEFLGLAKKKQRTFRFDAGLYRRFAIDARVTPTAVFHQVVLTRPSSVYATAFMFECMVQENNMPKDKCAALVYANDDQLHQTECRESFELMAECGLVVNLWQREKAMEQISELACSG